MSATCALGEILQLDELEELVQENYPMVLSSLLLRVGTANGMSTPQAAEQILSTFKQFIEIGKEVALESVMEKDGNWTKLAKPDFHVAITSIAAAVAKSHRELMKPIYNYLSGFVKGNFVGQKVVAATILAEFINHCKHDPSLLQELIYKLLSSLVDPTIKLQCLKGLGNIVSVGPEEANKYAPTVLDALMSSIDEINEVNAMQAMNGLAKIFELVEEQRMAPVLVNICNRIRPAFDKENDDIRSAAFNLFGSLYRFGSGSARDAFYEQIHNNLPSLLLHLNDSNETVRNACKAALSSLAALYRSEEVGNLFTSPFNDYNEFLNDVSIQLISSYPERLNYLVMTSINEYFKSSWDIVKANAAIFVGFILGNLPEDKKKTANLNPGLISKAIISLLKEKDPKVRKACADAMSLMHNY